MVAKYGVGLDNLDQEALSCAGIELRVAFGTAREAIDAMGRAAIQDLVDYFGL